MGYSEIVSTAAFLLGLFVAWRTRHWDRAVITVDGTNWPGGLGTAEPDKVSFSVEVSNTGNHSTQILSAFWQFERRGSGVSSMPASHGGGGFESLFYPPSSSKEPEYPFTLDRNHREAWNFEVSLDGLKDREDIIRMRPAVKFISRRFMSRKDHHVVYGPWQEPNFVVTVSARVGGEEEWIGKGRDQQPEHENDK